MPLVRNAAGGAPAYLGVAVVVGLVTGAVTQLLQGILPAEVGSLANSITPWLAVAFAVGSRSRRPALAAIAGAITLLGAVVGYYWLVQVRFGYAPEIRGTVLLWIIAAVVGGPIFGLAGSWWRGDRPWLRATAAALLGAAAIAEGAYLSRIETVAAIAPAYIIGGLLVPILLGRDREDRIRGLLLLVPCLALGVAGFVATIALNGLLVSL
jgi:hypothetical protein